MLSPPLFISAFVAGILMVLAPCTLPIVPAYIGFLGGLGAGSKTPDQETKKKRLRTFVHAVFFILGFSIIFVILGTTASALGQLFRSYQAIIQKIAGSLVILLGLFLVGVFKLPNLLLKEKRFFTLPKKIQEYGRLSSFITGASFAFGWSPCVGPILASVLFIAGTGGRALEGALLLSIFSLGLAIPFLVIALALERSLNLIQRYSWVLQGISVVSGIFLIGLGILIFTDNFLLLISWGYKIFRFLEYERLIEFL